MTQRGSDEKKAYAASHPFVLSVCVAACIGGLLFLIFPGPLEQGVLGRALPYGTERAWAALYCLGGGLVVNGFRQLDARYEVFGLLMLGGCYAAYGAAIFAAQGFGPGVSSLSVFTGLTVGCALRAYVLRFEPKLTSQDDRR